MIQEITEIDLKQVAEIHKKFLPSIIAYYSVEFIEKFYKNHLLAKKGTRIFLGKFEEGKLLGFVFGTHELDLLFDDFLKNNKGFFIKETMVALVKHPVYFIHLLGKIFHQKIENQCQSQLVYIVVDQNFNGKGIGKILLEAFEKEAKKTVDYYELEVEKNNPAFGFYKKSNFITVSEINGILEKKYLLGKNLK
ncbi:GNAT family N-acetyltransferase [Frigoriflavimonas asaccharolytica]|uniref:Ribosomal protein S18 acetylase RimI-like enzyme n=1 Tax=Frigoriflavimonas asaccharolytica TaxID=2735899 RepID=A0A8J8G812_9FLAO|nr:GNAT family N-acetyltransferase [Frigoriflavimonas asaccharolytica]NRS92661.1 ribosomal protein S18 acetylase RimI-like enzyme [Frigoriflavimonas asaccharolytica]